MKYSVPLLAGLSLLALASCQGNKNADTASARKLLDPANMDTTVRPNDNFYLYANGSWLKNNPIPADQTRWGSFNELIEDNNKKLHGLLEEAAASKAVSGSKDQLVGDLYKSGMDSAAIEKAGLNPLKPQFDRINAVTDANGLLREIAMEHTIGINALFGFYIGPDDKNVTKEMTQFFQGGLGMPDRDYYFKTDARSTAIRKAYKDYLVSLMMMLGDDSTAAQKNAAEEYNLEEKLAAASMTRVEMRDPYNVYHKFSLDAINKLTPGIDWAGMLNEMKIKGVDSVLVAQPKFFAVVAKELKATPLPVWKRYLQTQMTMDMSPYLSSKFDVAHFNFFGKTLRGQESQSPRWKRVLHVVDGSIGDMLGQLYVDKYFKPEAKKRMMDLVNNLQATYAERIKRLDWMTPETKTLALAKLNAFMKKIGYPDKWKTYEGLKIVPDDYASNIFATSNWDYNYQINKLGKPVDRSEWQMTPPTVNAYYNPAFNEIVFPAGILQYPFFDEQADDAVNYGGIGAVIGHEMTHGFDDQGRQYDANGNLKNWWTPADSAAFVQRANKVVQQFNNYTVLDTVHVNGELTEGENLADLGGVAIAYEAFKKTEQGKNGKKIDGFTPDQRFFLSWAQVWRANTRPQELAQRIITDPHAPSMLRCNGPLSNMPEFYAAFNIKPGDKMWRADSIRAKVW
ncbi:MAG: M13 family metallopeptidase [Bacteroidetes bacterium]|nr:M13 family metallopeptidase [Bacteroidota bacterium]MBS1630736.1 M13 family metallopeptidase [Bacteroidota bacterium]